MPLVKWTSSLSVGVYVFDVEHMQLFTLVNDFYESILAGVDKQAIRVILNGLHAYAERHFAHEEEFFDVCRYKKAAEHRMEHARLLVELEAFRNELLDGDINSIIVNLSDFLVTWSTHHTLSHDREFCAELRKIGIR
ncbi:hemerythrin [Rhizomicrobium palustre]|uniref:Hemerythrin n=1 Tax=Rhizomicrobium palustre TaxID=189966 RepID=A0A846N3E1_9PROT|nr:bacteriohemerythrin [Rhizomicrobium palustre]NIK89627.1 hemerythrin [Rhizomicrobium palustre]